MFFHANNLDKIVVNVKIFTSLISSNYLNTSVKYLKIITVIANKESKARITN